MAQSLKDSLFGGKLKNPHKQVEAARDSARQAAKDSAVLIAPAKKDSPSPAAGPVTAATENTGAVAQPVAEAAKPDDTMPDSLNQLYYAKQKAWKRFIDQQTLILATQADESKKVRKGEYYIEFDYVIGLNGRVKASNIICNPQNEFIIASMTDILTRTPVLAPPVYGDGKPRPLSAKQQITILKK